MTQQITQEGTADIPLPAMDCQLLMDAIRGKGIPLPIGVTFEMVEEKLRTYDAEQLLMLYYTGSIDG